MARLNGIGDEEFYRNDEIRSTWRRLLANEDEFIYDEQVEINREIAERLSTEQASNSKAKGEVLATLLEEQMRSSARSEVYVLCTMSIATKLDLEIQVLKNVKESEVRSCVVRAQSRRLILSGHAEKFLDMHWPGWTDIGENGNPNRQYSQVIVEGLAKLCKLGISKEDAKERLKAHIYKRRTARLPGVKNTPGIRTIDIKAVIADVTGVPLRQRAALKSPGKKVKRRRGTTYHPPSHPTKNDGPPQSKMLDRNQQPAELSIAEPSINDNDGSLQLMELEEPSDAPSTDSYDVDPVTPRSRQQTRTPILDQFTELTPAPANDTATEIEVGRSEWRNLSGNFDSPPQSYGIRSSAVASPSTECHNDTVTGFEVIQSKSLLNLKRPALNSPMLNKRRRADENQILEQALSTLGDNEKITGSFVNDILQHYLVDRPEVYLVDPSELAKWDTTSYWNTSVQNCTAASPEALEPKSARRLKARAARKFIIPFHHRIQEHWTLWVAVPDKDPGAWIFEHYDSLPWKSSGSSGELTHMENILRQYLGWLLQAPIAVVTAKVKECALQADSVSCGIYLIANAIAIVQDSEVPQNVDRQLLCRELQGLLPKPAVDVAVNRDPSNESVHSISPFDGPADSTPRRSGNPCTLAPLSRDSSTDPTSSKSCCSQQPSNMPQRHLLQAETALQVGSTDLTVSCKALKDLKGQVAEAKTLHEKYSQQAAEALAKQEIANRNIERIRNLEELPNADENDPSSTEILAGYYRSAEKAKADRMEYEDRAQAALMQWRAFDKPLRDAEENFMSRAIARTEMEEYVQHLRRFPGSGTDG